MILNNYQKVKRIKKDTIKKISLNKINKNKSMKFYQNLQNLKINKAFKI